MTNQYQRRSINDDNPNEVLIFRDDFLSPAVEGSMNWRFTASGGGSGAGSRWGGSDLQNHPGVVALSVAAGAGTATIAQGVNLVPQGLSLEAVVQLLDLNDPGVDEHTFGFGFNTVGAVNSMVLFYDENSPNWQAQTIANGATDGPTDTGVLVNQFQGYRLRIQADITGNDGDGSVLYFVDDVQVAISSVMNAAAIYAPALRMSRTFASSQGATGSADIISMYQALSR